MLDGKACLPATFLILMVININLHLDINATCHFLTLLFYQKIQTKKNWASHLFFFVLKEIFFINKRKKNKLCREKIEWRHLVVNTLRHANWEWWSRMRSIFSSAYLHDYSLVFLERWRTLVIKRSCCETWEPWKRDIFTSWVSILRTNTESRCKGNFTNLTFF